jgi:hypothetical protein
MSHREKRTPEQAAASNMLNACLLHPCSDAVGPYESGPPENVASTPLFVGDIVGCGHLDLQNLRQEGSGVRCSALLVKPLAEHAECAGQETSLLGNTS